ncbi:hypothetical protein BGI39_04390 [Snodgrassella communis]|nr:hypothetical protein BGI39_04390 [Snodgrassella communis]
MAVCQRPYLVVDFFPIHIESIQLVVLIPYLKNTHKQSWLIGYFALKKIVVYFLVVIIATKFFISFYALDCSNQMNQNSQI